MSAHSRVIEDGYGGFVVGTRFKQGVIRFLEVAQFDLTNVV